MRGGKRMADFDAQRKVERRRKRQRRLKPSRSNAGLAGTGDDMKHAQQPWKKTGLCHVCGKPTKLLIHQPCGAKMDAAKKAHKVAGVGRGELNQQHQENSKHNAAKRRYAAGYVPKFCDG